MREEQAVGPKKPNRLGSYDITAGITEWYGRKYKTAKKSKRTG